MSEQKLVSPLLDGFVMGNPMRDRDGIICRPALKENTDEKYIVKTISVPESQVQLDALLLTGAYRDPAEAMTYFKEVADGIVSEVEILNTLASLEGFLPYDGYQVVPMEDGRLGYEVHLLSTYRRSLLRHMSRKPITHLDAVNLGLDLCASLSICRRAGFLYVDLKPSNVFLTRQKQYKIGDLGFVRLDSLSYTSLPGKYRSAYCPPEAMDDLKTLNETVDTYAVGMILYQIYNNGDLPASPLEPKDPFPHPANADYEISAIIIKAVDPDPAKRWKDPMEMGQALVLYMQKNAVNNVPITPPSGILPEAKPEQAAPSGPEIADVSETEPETAPMAEDASAEPEEPAEQAIPETEAPAVPEEPEADVSVEASEDAPEPADDDDLDFSIAFSSPGIAEKADVQPEPVRPKPAPVRRKRRRNTRSILISLILLVLLLLLGCGAFWYYQTIYLQPIHSLALDGTQHELTVSVEAGVDTSHILVTCTDTYGNSTTQPLVNGQTRFTDLLPDSLYRIELSAEGFHELTGKTADIFTTDAIPTIVSISAVTGPEDGSVILNFTVDGDDPDEWVVTATADAEQEIRQQFIGHSVTLKGLTVGKLYTLTLGTGNGDQILGTPSIDFTATSLIMAENLTISDYTDGTMTVRWDAPADAQVEKWTVRCYDNQGHEELLEIAGTEIAFTGIDSTRSYTVEVTASGMTQAARVSISENPLTVTGFTVDDSAPDKLSISWTYTGDAPEEGWLLLYTLDGIQEQQNVAKCPEPSAVIDLRIPNAKYDFQIQSADSTSVFNNSHSFICPGAAVYTNQGLSADKITSHLLKTPDAEDWTIDSIGEDAYTDTFQPGDSISVVLTARDNFYLPEMDIDVMYVIRNADGNVLSKYVSTETIDWKTLWYDADYHNGELTVPKVPQEPGNYSLSIYFDNQAVTATNFSIAE